VQQGLSSTAVALLAGGDALTGILGTFVFPVLRKRFSLEKIGLTAMVFHFLCGSVCVSSNWLPGSPFDPMFLLSDRPAASSTPWSPGPVLGTTASPFSLAENNFAISLNGNFSVTLKPGDVRQLNNSTIGGATGTDWTSLIVFSAGLTLGRFAFWVIDLTGSQILLESVRDEHRGTICAVHYALKKLLNRVKYVMALFLAWPQTFGFLIIASQIFSLMGYGFFVVYCRIESVRKRCDTSAKSSNQKLNFREIQQ
jgi:solute carrier family 40 (iron-regulated transporter), member 1